MNDSHDNAAGRAAEPLPSVAELELFLRSWIHQHGDDDYLLDAIIPEGGYVPLTISGLRAVVAENKTMQQQLARLKTEWEVRVERPGRPRTQGTFNAAVIAHGAADAIQQGEPDATISVRSRLVGEWQPAGPAQDEQADTDGTTSEGN